MAAILSSFAETDSAVIFTLSAVTMTWSAVTMTWFAVTMTWSAVIITWSAVTMTWSAVTMTWSAVTMTWSAVAMTWSGVTMIFRPYSDSYCSVSFYFNFRSSISLCPTGVPQGPVFGPQLFSLYTSPISHIVSSLSTATTICERHADLCRCLTP